MNALNSCAALLLSAAGKSVFLLGVLAAGMLACRRGPAATRHFLWLTGLLALLILPFNTLLPRPWPVKAWMQDANFINHWLDNLNTLPEKVFSSSVELHSQPDTAQPPDRRTQGAAAVPGSRRQALLSIQMVVFAVWMIGLTAVATRALGRLRSLRKLQRVSLSLNDAVCRAVLVSEQEALGIDREVILLQSAEPIMPMTWGWCRSVLLLPPQAGQWDPERLRLVIRHELAHVRRWDCLTQGLAQIICALYWFNPLAWLAASQMRLERERACDDLVVSAGALPSNYAEHLLHIAQQSSFVPPLAAIPMAKPSTLEKRLRAIVDARRQHGGLHPAVALLVVLCLGVAIIGLAGGKSHAGDQAGNDSESLRRQQMAQVQAFSIAKEKQSRVLAAQAGEQFLPDYQWLFDAATNGNWQVVTNLYEDFKRRHAQYRHDGPQTNELPHTSYWSPILEICLAYWEMANGEPKYTQVFVDDTINSIPAGSIYFGGTDPGRGLITAFSKSHADADPFFTLTQNALADGSYLDYLRAIYGAKIYTPTAADSQNCFTEYLADVEKRLKENKLKPGEDAKTVDGKVQVTGQVAVMSINALLAKIIFDKNPDREFYIEESFPLEWMYPHLEPHGVIMKINRQPLAQIPPDILQRDREYWNQRVSEMLGNSLTEQTSVQTVADFVQKTYARRDLTGFNGDPRFIQNDVPQKIFSKLRCSIAGIYAWRREHASSDAEKSQMTAEADFAFKQAWVLCPYSPEALFRYVNLLLAEKRKSDALAIAEAAAALCSVSPAIDVGQCGQIKDLIERLKHLPE
jgi:beta-lactamase regulating signal transducer with metallopeptidase domain